MSRRAPRQIAGQELDRQTEGLQVGDRIDGARTHGLVDLPHRAQTTVHGQHDPRVEQRAVAEVITNAVDHAIGDTI